MSEAEHIAEKALTDEQARQVVAVRAAQVARIIVRDTGVTLRPAAIAADSLARLGLLAGPFVNWPCDDYRAPLTCYTVPNGPKHLTCGGCRDAFPNGPEVQALYRKEAIRDEQSAEAAPMRVLVACESSGVVRDAFIRLGHDAVSCDLLPSESDFGPHVQGDVTPLLRQPWDLVIAHPTCTYLCKSGLRWMYEQPDRWQHLIDGATFFRACLEANAPRVAVENPSMHRWAKKIVGRQYDQLVQPYMFGHTERKGTGLWLRGLPPLLATEDVQAATMALPARERDRVHWAPPGPDRWKTRSRTYTGIAEAMAEQWGGRVREVVAS